jgi:hypothetical protein
VNVVPLEPDAPAGGPRAPQTGYDPFGSLLDAAGTALDRAARAERSFVEHRGGLIEMVVERAAADVMLQLATSAAQRTTQAISTLLGMQV